MFCFASNSVITRYLVLGNQLSPFTLTTVRFASGLVMLFLLQRSLPQRFQYVRPTKANALGGLLLGAYAFAISYGYAYISVAAGTLVFYGCVVITMSLYSYLHDKDKVRIRPVLGQILAFLGIIVLGLSVVLRTLIPTSVTFDFTLGGMGLALYMGMISTALSYVLWHKVLRRITSSQGGISQLLAPILSSIMGVLLLGEHITSALLLGGVAILAGIYLNT